MGVEIVITEKEEGQEVWLVNDNEPLEYVKVVATTNNYAIVSSHGGRALVRSENLFLNRGEAISFQESLCLKRINELDAQVKFSEARVNQFTGDIKHLRGKISDYQRVLDFNTKEVQE